MATSSGIGRGPNQQYFGRNHRHQQDNHHDQGRYYYGDSQRAFAYDDDDDDDDNDETTNEQGYEHDDPRYPHHHLGGGHRAGAGGDHHHHHHHIGHQHQGYDDDDDNDHHGGGRYDYGHHHQHQQELEHEGYDEDMGSYYGEGGGGGGGGPPDDESHQQQYDEDMGRNYHQQHTNDGGAGAGAGAALRRPPPHHSTNHHHHSAEQSMQSGTDYSTIPDIMYLNHYCATAHPPKDVNSEESKQEAEMSWEPAREWLRTHSAEEVMAAAQQRGDQAMTALHFACRNCPPEDIIDVLLSIAIDTTKWQDSFGWLPMHYACACGAGTNVIKKLAEAFPESKTALDRRGRTPLHFALGNSDPNHPVSPEVVVLLSSSRAAEYADDTGMLPLHYACAYGASEAVMRVLTDAYDEAITTMDRLGRTPLHFALSNAGRKAAPAAVRLLLGRHKEIANANSGGGPLPLRVLAEYATTVRKDATQQKESVEKCLELLLSFHPEPTADFFTALQSLPDWLREIAVVIPGVQTLLNDKIAQRFPTGVLLADFFVQVVVICLYAFLVPLAIDRRFDETHIRYGDAIDYAYLVPLYLGALYFLVRTFVQILSLWALGALGVWIYDPTKWLDILYIFVVFYWSTRMLYDPVIENGSNMNEEEKELFRTGSAFSVLVLWTKLLAYLRNTYIDFAVLVGGLFHILKRLFAFLVCLCITLIAFSQMFFTVYRQSDPRCTNQPNSNLSDAELIANLQCEDNQVEVVCDRWNAFLYSFTMLLGQVDDTIFNDNTFATVLFVLFMFLVVILLANVLIAIVTDSYKVIQDYRSAIVFWTNRLDFIAEMDAIANGPWKNQLKEIFGIYTGPKHKHKQDDNEDDKVHSFEVTFGRAGWERLTGLYFDDDNYGDGGGFFSIEFICITILRFLVAVLIIPLWIFIGLLSLGSLWPPQIREKLFTSKVTKHSSDSAKEDEMRKAQIEILRNEVSSLKFDLKRELAIDRTHVVQMKSLAVERRIELQNEMKHIKRMVAMLFEQQNSMME